MKSVTKQAIQKRVAERAGSTHRGQVLLVEEGARDEDDGAD